MFSARARLFNSVVSSMGIWGMETLQTRQKDTEAMSTASLTMLSWTNPTRQVKEDEWRWRTSTFNTLGYSLWGPAQVKPWLTFVGHVFRIDDTRIAKQVLEFRSSFEWQRRRTLVGDRGGGGRPLRHCGRRVRPCVCEKVPEQASNMWQQLPQVSTWTEGPCEEGQSSLFLSLGEICRLVRVAHHDLPITV